MRPLRLHLASWPRLRRGHAIRSSARCKTTVHIECLTERQGVCPVCAKPLDRPEQHFYYSKFCSVCGARNTPPKSNCSNCGNATQWDSEEEYVAFRCHVMASSRSQMFIGLVQIGFGLLVVMGYLLALGLLLQSGRWFVSGLLIFAVIYLLGRGGKNFWNGWRMRSFE